MKRSIAILSTGFALFSMFFGSGNLVFPITVGEQSAGHYGFAALGILLTGVIVPFLGVFAMVLYNGNLPNFFRLFGAKGTFIFSFLALALMGPFGVLARCLTVAHGASLLLMPKLSLPVASLFFCMIIFIFSFNKSSLLSRLGLFLTPFLLFSIAMIAFFGFKAGSFPISVEGTKWSALKMGFFQGYQTMDLLAAFFFSHFVIAQLKKEQTNQQIVLRPTLLSHFCQSALVGGALLAIVYFALVLLGWLYSPFLIEVAPQKRLGVIATEALGSFAAPIVCVAIILACMTTAIVLTSLFADFLRKNIKINHPFSLLVTLLIGFFVSTFDFAAIAKLISPILEAIYPALIALTLFNIAAFFFNKQISTSKASIKTKES